MKVTILSGVPGCGKSTWAEKQDANIVSADAHLLNDPKPEDFGIAHAACYRDYIGLLRNGAEHVIVDNTNLTAWEIAPYHLAAEAAGYQVTIKRFTPPDLEECFKRNAHEVPFKTFCIMVANFTKRDVLPWWNVEDA